jgi:hypothetical protein
MNHGGKVRATSETYCMAQMCFLFIGGLHNFVLQTLWLSERHHWGAYGCGYVDFLLMIT